MTWPNIDTFSFAAGLFASMSLNLLEAFIRGFLRGVRKPEVAEPPTWRCGNCDREFLAGDVHGNDTCTVMTSNGRIIQVTDVEKIKDNVSVQLSVDGKVIAEYVDKCMRKH